MNNTDLVQEIIKRCYKINGGHKCYIKKNIKKHPQEQAVLQSAQSVSKLRSKDCRRSD